MYCILVNADIPKTIWREKIYEHKRKIHLDLDGLNILGFRQMKLRSKIISSDM